MTPTTFRLQEIQAKDFSSVQVFAMLMGAKYRIMELDGEIVYDGLQLELMDQLIDIDVDTVQLIDIDVDTVLLMDIVIDIVIVIEGVGIIVPVIVIDIVCDGEFVKVIVDVIV